MAMSQSRPHRGFSSTSHASVYTGLGWVRWRYWRSEKIFGSWSGYWVLKNQPVHLQEHHPKYTLNIYNIYIYIYVYIYIYTMYVYIYIQLYTCIYHSISSFCGILWHCPRNLRSYLLIVGTLLSLCSFRYSHGCWMMPLWQTKSWLDDIWWACLARYVHSVHQRRHQLSTVAVRILSCYVMLRYWCNLFEVVSCFLLLQEWRLVRQLLYGMMTYYGVTPLDTSVFCGEKLGWAAGEPQMGTDLDCAGNILDSPRCVQLRTGLESFHRWIWIWFFQTRNILADGRLILFMWNPVFCIVYWIFTHLEGG